MNHKYLIASLFLTLSNLILQILTPWIFLKFIAQDDYSQWIFWFSCLSYLSLIDFGSISFAQYRSLKSRQYYIKRKNYYLISLRPTVLLASILMVIFLIYVCRCGYIPFFFVILSIVPLLQLQTRITSVAFRIKGNYDIYCYFMAVANILFPFLLFLMLDKTEASLNEIALLYLALHLFISGLLLFPTKDLLSLSYIHRFKRIYVRSLYKCFHYFILMLMPTLINNLPIILLALAFEPIFLIQFHSIRILCNFGIVLGNLLYASSIPELVDKNLSSANIRRTMSLITVSLTIIFLILICSIFLFKGILESYWLRDEIELDSSIIIVTMISAFMSSCIYFGVNILQAFGHPEKILIGLIVYVVASFSAVYIIGLQDVLDHGLSNQVSLFIIIVIPGFLALLSVGLPSIAELQSQFQKRGDRSS